MAEWACATRLWRVDVAVIIVVEAVALDDIVLLECATFDIVFTIFGCCKPLAFSLGAATQKHTNICVAVAALGAFSYGCCD